MSDTSMLLDNMPEALTAFWDRIRTNGEGEGTGKAAMVKTAMDFAGMVYRNEMDPDDAGKVYARHRNAAEMAAIAINAPLKQQSDASLASQKSKLRAVADLACAGRMTPIVWEALGWAEKASRGKYTPFLAGVSATSKKLALKRDTDAATLRPIVEAAASPKANAPASLAKRLDTLAKQLESILSDEEGQFDAEVAAIASRFGGTPVDKLATTARTVADMAKMVVNEAKPDPQL